MGVDYIKCDHCDRCFADCEGWHHQCGGCRQTACPTCATQTQYFWFAGRERCSDCWNDDQPEQPSDGQVLDYVCGKFGVEVDAMYDEFRVRHPKRYRDPPDRYYCTAHDDCRGCERVDETYDRGDGSQERGLCCRAKSERDTHHGYPVRDAAWCSPCLEHARTQKKLKAE